MKLSILLVDDEVSLVQGLKRMLRPLRDTWEFYFAYSGKEALEVLSSTKIHVIVSDMRMPEMSGLELLEIVKEKYPSIIRLILSGQSNEEAALKSASVIHQYIAKPIEPEILKEKIKSAYHLYSVLENDTLRNVIHGIDKLPSIPDIYYKIEKELNKEDFSLQKLSNLIEKDIAMSAKVLQIVNSAFFGLSTKITNVNQAVNYLGSNTIKSLVVMVHVFEAFEGNNKIKELIEEIYRHSIKVANGAKKIIVKYGDKSENTDDIFLAGILHDIGKILILNTKKYREPISELIENGVDYDNAEYQVLGTTHAEVGGYLLSLWGLPKNVVEAVLLHHKPVSLDSEKKVSIVTALHLANLAVNYPNLNTDYAKSLEVEDKMLDLIELCSSENNIGD